MKTQCASFSEQMTKPLINGDGRNRKRCRQLGSVVAVGVLFLTSCGTTSDLQRTQTLTGTPSGRYSKVIVRDFKVAVSEHAEEASSSAVTFADLIANEIRKSRRFSSVLRNGASDSNTLVIDGIVTKYDEGSISKRIFLGLGFGMSFSEAIVN